jgi:hypothetical protein
VTVDAGAQAHARVAQRAEIGVTVAEIALGRRVDAGVGARAAEQRRLVRQEVRRVDGDEARAEDAVMGQQLDRTEPRLADAGLDLSGLLGDVHVQR